MGSAAGVTEIPKPSPSGILHLGSHLHLGELTGRCQLRDSPANQEKKRKKKRGGIQVRNLASALKKSTSGGGCLVLLCPLGT